SPRTTVRSFTLLFGADGVLQRVETVSRPADAAPAAPGTRTVVVFAGDSATIETTRADGASSTRRIAWGPEYSPLNFGIYAPYEVIRQELLGRDGADSSPHGFW